MSKNQSNIDAVDYLLVGFGVLLLPLYLIGLIFIGIFLWRLGSKWEQHNEEENEYVDEFDIAQNPSEPKNDWSEMKSFSDDTLKEMK